MNNRVRPLHPKLTLVVLLGILSPCLAQPGTPAQPADTQPDPQTSEPASAPESLLNRYFGRDLPLWIRQIIPPANELEARRFALIHPQRRQFEVQLRKIRTRYIRGIRKTEIRQVGISKLRAFTDPDAFPALLDLFKREKPDVRVAILDHLASLGTEEADTALAWAAVFDRDKAIRAQAASRVAARVEESGSTVPDGVKIVLAHALGQRRDAAASAAANLSRVLKLYEAIPALITAQVRSEQRTGRGALATILVGQQVPFVSDLQPVVGESAVGFDPTISVVTEGVVMQIDDAVVTTYRVEVHNALVGLASAAWGHDTSSLAYDLPRWRHWYAHDLLPTLAARRSADEPDPG